MARTGRTLTRTMQLETRQHEMMGLDFGDGLPRAAMLWGLVVFAAWALLMLVIFRGPPTQHTLLLWMLPPTLVAVFGWQRSHATPRRRRVTEWVLAIRWILVGHSPVVVLGRQRGTSLPLKHRLVDRMGADSRVAERLVPRSVRNASRERTGGGTHANPRAVTIAGRVLLVGTDRVQGITAPAQDRTTTRDGNA